MLDKPSKKWNTDQFQVLQIPGRSQACHQGNVLQRVCGSCTQQGQKDKADCPLLPELSHGRIKTHPHISLQSRKPTEAHSTKQGTGQGEISVQHHRSNKGCSQNVEFQDFNRPRFPTCSTIPFRQEESLLPAQFLMTKARKLIQRKSLKGCGLVSLTHFK